jgi:hypothetical protein
MRFIWLVYINGETEIMQFHKYLTALAIAFTTFTTATSAIADQTIRCESHNQNYHFCPVDTHGYVRLDRQTSKHHPCRQGRNWDYDRRGIWVDDGCKATFVVEDRHHTDRHKDHHGKEAVAAAAAIALIAAAASASNDKHDHYHDDDYGHSGHSSYLPHWQIGDFSGYNLQYGTQVDMHISSDGRLRAHVNGVTLTGYVNDDRAYIGDSEFFIDKAGDGFNTTQVGNRSNKVHYSRK